MSIIYSNSNSAVSQQPQSYHLENISKIEAYRLEIKEQKYLSKIISRFKTTTCVLDVDLIKSAVVTGGTSTATFSSSIGLLVRIRLSGASVFFSLDITNTQVTSNAEEKLDSS